MAYEYRVTEAADGTFPVELWSSKGGREQLLYKTPGFQTRQLAEAWIVPVEVQSAEAPQLQPRARVTYLKPRRSRVVIVSKPNPHPPLVSPPALPEFLNFSQSGAFVYPTVFGLRAAARCWRCQLRRPGSQRVVVALPESVIRDCAVRDTLGCRAAIHWRPQSEQNCSLRRFRYPEPFIFVPVVRLYPKGTSHDEDCFRRGDCCGGADTCFVACRRHSSRGPNSKDGSRRRCSDRAGPRPSPTERLRCHRWHRLRRRHRRPTAKLPHGDHDSRPGRWPLNHT